MNEVYLIRAWMNNAIVCTSVYRNLADAMKVAASSLAQDPFDYYDIIQYRQTDEDYEMIRSWKLECDIRNLPF